jgi:hypothetical protein
VFPSSSQCVLIKFAKGFPKIGELWLVGTIIRNDLAKHMGENVFKEHMENMLGTLLGEQNPSPPK